MGRLTRRRRRIVALIALCALLFQQLAMAAYACPMDQMRAQAAPMKCHPAGAADAARCQEHCHPLTASTGHAAPPAIPAALLPPLDWPRVAALGADDACARHAPPPRGADPPPDIRFCRLLI